MSPDSKHTGWGRIQRILVGAPVAVRSRVLVLFGALTLIQLVLFIGLRKHLQEIHWRYDAEPGHWILGLGFYALAIVGICTLVQLGRQCQPAGVRAVRLANLLVLGLGALLIFGSFHEGDKNYVYPVMTGVLKWSNLTAYLSLDFFFRPPYLAVWIFAYVLGYYALARSGRERHALTITAAFAGLYWLLCCQEFIYRRSDVWLVMLFGLVSLFMLRGRKRSFHPAWQLTALVWTILVWFLFWLGLPQVGRFPPYFTILSGWLAVLFVGSLLLARREGFLQAWAGVATFYFVAVLLLASVNYPKAQNYNYLLGFAAKFPHYFLGGLVVTGILGVMALLYSRVRPGGSWRWLDVISLGVILLALVDLRLTQIMGVRLGWDVLAFGNDPKMMWRLARPYLPALAAAIVIAGLIYAGAVRAVAWWLRRAADNQDSNGRLSAGWYLAGCFTLFAVLGSVITKPDNAEGQSLLRLVQTSPLWKRTVNRMLKPEEFFGTARALGITDLGTPSNARPVQKPRDLNVLLIFQESTYNQYLSLLSGPRQTQPLLSNYKDRMEIFPNFFSSFAGSIHARFATFTGLYPVSDFSLFTLNRVPVKSLFEVLGEQGYACSMFYSSHFDYTGFRSFLNNRHLTEWYDADTMPGGQGAEQVSWGLKEETTMQAIRQQIRKYAGSKERFFLTYVPAAPHYPYDKIPKEFREFKMDRYGDYTPLYLNELLYMDWIMASILDELKTTGLLEKTLVVITADHGEMLGADDGPLGHGWKITPELANVPLIILDPERKGCRVNDAVGSQVDLLPTLCDSLGIALPAGELYQGHSLYSSNQFANRQIFLSSYDEFGVITGDEIHTGSRRAAGGGQPGQAGTCYHISNQGAATIFTKTNNTASPALSIQQFDEFQEGFLRNYAFYRDSLRAVPSTNLVHNSR